MPHWKECRLCGKADRDVMAYCIRPGRQFKTVWLHQHCSGEWHNKYRRWLRERQ